jgi:general secretion pathway protein L
MAALRSALGARRPPAQLLLPPGTVLEHAVTLPLAAERDPESVLRYEMDRLTPFAAAELYWTWAIDRRDRARSQLHLRLSLVLRAQVDAALFMLRQAGLHPSALAGETGRVIPLEPAGTSRWRRRTASALAVACGLLAIAAIAIPFIGQSRETRRIERQIAAHRPAVERSETLRRNMAAAAAGVDVLAAQRTRLGDPLAVLAALTDILPDDTVLTDLTLRQRVITISGQSGTAARLIAALAADPAIRNPNFTAPVTRNETTHTDIFSIRAEAASAAETASAAPIAAGSARRPGGRPGERPEGREQARPNNP